MRNRLVPALVIIAGSLAAGCSDDEGPGSNQIEGVFQRDVLGE